MKKTIHWYEKRGKGSYFDPKLNRFANPANHGFDDELQMARDSSYPELTEKHFFWTRLLNIFKKRKP